MVDALIYNLEATYNETSLLDRMRCLFRLRLYQYFRIRTPFYRFQNVLSLKTSCGYSEFNFCCNNDPMPQILTRPHLKLQALGYLIHNAGRYSVKQPKFPEIMHVPMCQSHEPGRTSIIPPWKTGVSSHLEPLGQSAFS